MWEEKVSDKKKYILILPNIRMWFIYTSTDTFTDITPHLLLSTVIDRVDTISTLCDIFSETHADFVTQQLLFKQREFLMFVKQREFLVFEPKNKFCW